MISLLQTQAIGCNRKGDKNETWKYEKNCMDFDNSLFFCNAVRPADICTGLREHGR
jgi:hypothetical protein